MIVYEFQCQQCNQVSEHFMNMSDCPVTVQCPSCRGIASKIISIPGANLASESPDWIKTLKEVVNKEGGAHCQEFLKNPTRDNYKAWMKGEGIRHLETGERMRPEQKEITPEQIMKHRQQKRAINLRS